MTADYLQTRGDFRCTICRDKGCFHCEHDTPYRDQYLGTFDPHTPRNHDINTRRSKSETRMHNNSTNSGRQPNSTNPGGQNTARQGHSNTNGQPQQGKKLNNPTGAQHNNNNTQAQSQATKDNKTSKSCVIL